MAGHDPLVAGLPAVKAPGCSISRSGNDPVLYLNNPKGVTQDIRQQTLGDIGALNRLRHAEVGDPEIETRIAQYEMAHRMQTSVPELTDLSDEPESTFELYGEDARKPGTYAYNVLMARRLAERGTRYTQVFHRGWDTHSSTAGRLPKLCKQTDQASAAVTDLKNRGLLDDPGDLGR